MCITGVWTELCRNVTNGHGLSTILGHNLHEWAGGIYVTHISVLRIGRVTLAYNIRTGFKFQYFAAQQSSTVNTCMVLCCSM